jgi:hypothetical protein
MDEKIIRVIRDIAEAVLEGTRPFINKGKDRDLPVDVVHVVACHIYDALDKHLFAGDKE